MYLYEFQFYTLMLIDFWSGVAFLIYILKRVEKLHHNVSTLITHNQKLLALLYSICGILIMAHVKQTISTTPIQGKIWWGVVSIAS